MKKILIFGFAFLSLFTSCEDYIDVNEQQSNSPNADDLTPKQMLAGAINNYTSLQVTTLATYGNRMTYVWGLNSGFTSSDPAWTYNFDSGSYTNNFESTYLFADNFQDIVDKKAKFPEYAYHFGVAKIFKVMCMDYITALYGDAPYSEAFRSDINTPKYDDDKAIIPGLFAELDEARAYLATADAMPLGTEDIVFKGNVAKWVQFLNTIELKILVRLSKTTDAKLVALRSARFAKLETNKNFVSTDVAVNPGYIVATLGQRTPVFRTLGLDEALAAWTSANRANAAGDYIAKLVNGEFTDANITANIVDPRRSRMFTLVGGKVLGNVQGIFPLTAISRVANFYIGRINGDNNSAASRDAYLMLAAESAFLQAEAIQRGFLTGDAKAKFEEGIKASFSFYSKPFGAHDATVITPLDATAYITAVDGKNGLGWTGSADKINAIMTQKYLALAQWQGIELYIDQQRTGFPVLPLPFGVTQTKRPNRLIYPSSEYSSNSNNVPAVTNAELFTINSKTPYYLQ